MGFVFATSALGLPHRVPERCLRLLVLLSQTVQEARDLDDKIFGNWSRPHPRVLKLGNDTDFQTKIEACGKGVLEMVADMA